MALQIFLHSQILGPCRSPKHGRGQLNSGKGRRGKAFQTDLSTQHTVSAQRISENGIREPSVMS